MADVPDLLTREGVRLGCTATDRFDAVRQTGELLLELGAVEPAYLDAMQERERMVPSYVGEGFALPHGTDEARAYVRRPCLVFLQFPDGVDWDGDEAKACVGIAAARDEHVSVMAALARILLEPDKAEALRTTDDPDEVVRLLTSQAEAKEEVP
ncbi:MAG TPA: PTS sugar transporter subunit IIA [Egibacteraceae bacterium]